MSSGRKWQPVPGGRALPSIRPAQPVPTSDIPPDDLLCTWVFRITSTAGNGTGYWELKYIHAGCRQHASVPRAA